MNRRAVGFLAAVLIIVSMVGLWPGAASAGTREIDYRPLQEDLRHFLSMQAGDYGFFLIDLRSGKTAGINDRTVFYAASTFKVPMTLYVYRRVAAGDLNHAMLLEMQPEHMEGGTGSLQFSPAGTKKSVTDLVRYTIVYSDNVATNMLLEHVGIRAVKDYMTRLGGTVVKYEENETSPRDMALYMREVVRFAGDSPWGEKLLDHLRNTIYTDRIPHPLPDVPVAAKIGNWPITGTYNDVAYVEHPKRPYILAVFSTHTPDYDSAVLSIREVSRRVFDYQTNPPRPVKIALNGRILYLTEKPFISRGVTLVPLGALADALPQLSLGWDESAGQIILDSTLGGVPVKVAIHRGAGEVVIIEERSYLPVRHLSRSLNLGLAWDGDNRLVKLVSPVKE